MPNAPTGNTATVLNDIATDSASATNVVSDLLGALADASGAVGGIFSVVQTLLNLGQPDPVMVALQTLQNTIQTDFQLLNAGEEATEILQQNDNSTSYVSLAETGLDGLLGFINANPTAAEAAAYINQWAIEPLNGLGGGVPPSPPTTVWDQPVEWQVYWTDAGQFSCVCPIGLPPQLPAGGQDAGYGLQQPPLNKDGVTAFIYTYSLPLYLQAVRIFLSVAGSLDPNFATDYADVLRSAASFLQSVHDHIMQSGLTQLSPPAPSDPSFFYLACDASGPVGPLPGPAGIRIYYSIGQRGAFNQIGTFIEYGAVEKFSGYSSTDGYYYISGDGYSADIFGKLQIRLMKRAKDVYVGVGLPRVWQVINQLKGIVGDPPLPGPSFADWSLRQVFNVSGLPPGAGGFSLRALAALIIQTQPPDTLYSFGPANVTVSMRELLTDLTPYAVPTGGYPG